MVERTFIPTNPTSPFKNNNEVVTEESRKFRTGNSYKKKQFKQDLEQYKEEDVKEVLRKGKTLISYVEDRTHFNKAIIMYSASNDSD